MNGFTVLVDACVLYPAPLRDLVMHLALVDLFRAKWTDRIHEEWMRSVLADRPDLRREQLERTRSLMDLHARDALVTGYEPLIDGLTLPDPDDRHVLAAAIRCDADLILTFNLKDFPPAALAPFGIEVQHPDTFLLNQLDLDQAKVFTAVKRQRESLKNPPKQTLEFLAVLEQQQLPLTVAELRKFADVL
jgi:hypothetical protein